MCLQKSNKWARWKLVLLLPVAACTLYAFARPDVNRQFEQLIPSESTTIPQDNKQIPAEMISSELNTQINALPERSRYQWLKENYHTRTLWVNSKAVILYDNDFATRQQLPDKLAKSLQVDYANNKPVLVYCLYDRDAPVSAVDSIRQIVVSTVKQYSASLKAKGLQVYIYEGDPHMFASTSKGDPVVVTFYEGAEATTSLVIYNDNTIQVKSDINKKGYGNVSLVRINAPKDTPMGKIADIKEAIRQLWEENGLDSTGLQYIYRIQQTLPVG